MRIIIQNDNGEDIDSLLIKDSDMSVLGMNRFFSIVSQMIVNQIITRRQTNQANILKIIQEMKKNEEEED